MRTPPSYTRKEEATAYYDASRHDEVVTLFHRRELVVNEIEKRK
jgi:hypothetical protein